MRPGQVVPRKCGVSGVGVVNDPQLEKEKK